MSALSACESRCEQTHKQAPTHAHTHTHIHTHTYTYTHTHIHTHTRNSSICSCHILKLESVITILKYWTTGPKQKWINLIVTVCSIRYLTNNIFHLVSYTNKCTDYHTLFKISLKSFTLKHSHSFYMFWHIVLKSFTLKHSHSFYMFWYIVCQPRGALFVLAKITCKTWTLHSVKGVAAYHEFACAVCSVCAC
jgi:hypothetical protein